MYWTPEISDTLRRYLKLGNHPKVLARAQAIWQEARTLASDHRWHCRMTRQGFETRFMPFAKASAALQAVLGPCDQVYLMAVSLGGALEKQVRWYMEGRRPFEGFLLDRMGSFMAEAAMQRLDRRLEQHCMDSGERTTRRFSPGYRDFSLAAQQVFIELIGDRLPDLHLAANGQLQPEKSITAIKGAARRSAG